MDMEALRISYNAAITMLELVADESNTSSLYFAQDSVHVMIAYAAVFLIKVRIVLSSTNSTADPLTCCSWCFQSQAPYATKLKLQQ